MRVNGRVRVWLGAAFGILASILLGVVSLLPTSVSAAQITTRSLTLSTSAPSTTASHTFAFTLPTAGNVGSIKFEYCTTSSGTCGTVTGLSTSSATLTAQNGATGFTINNSTPNSPYITRTAASISTNTAVSYTLGNITNPSTANQSFFVRITSYSAGALGGSAVDTGVVTASTATQITLSGTMPESIVFCTGDTVSLTAGIPDCTTAGPGAISFNQLFSPSAAATASSQMAVSTNAASGYVITVNGATMTSGSATIAAMNPATTATVGHGQFGMNLVANTTASSTPAVGAALNPATNGTSYKGEALTGYGTADTFKFLSGDSIADSASGGAGPTDAQIYTASYIVNVSGGQLAGTYTTTLTYICTATF